MNRFSGTEFLLIKYLYNRENAANNGETLVSTELNLREKDEISRIRETVFYIEKLEREGFLMTDPEFYSESDHMSFTYLNSAVELNEDRIHLSDEGRKLITQYQDSSHFVSAYKQIMDTPETKNVLLAVSFGMTVLGVIIGYMAGKVF